MNKFKVSFKITGLELQVEGSRDDVGLITNSIGQQFKGLIEPIGSVANGDEKSNLAITEDGEFSEYKPKKGKKKAHVSTGKKEKPAPIEFKNNSTKYGSPIQGWTTLEKAMWMLYVLRSENNLEELHAREIADTFNTHFKQQGTIRATNVSRDFGNQKAGAKALLGENANVNPAKWYLTEEGVKTVQKQIQSLHTQE